MFFLTLLWLGELIIRSLAEVAPSNIACYIFIYILPIEFGYYLVVSFVTT